jgi:GNAT superfamily N-acetyltransferase
MVQFTVCELREEQTYDLRRRVSADGLVLPTWHHDLDSTTGAWHLGAIGAAGRVIATASLYPVPYPLCPGAKPATVLKFMAVDPGAQHQGVGTAVLSEILRRLRADGVRLVWASARDDAIPFYRRLGFTAHEPLPPGGPGTRPHHLIHLDLGARSTSSAAPTNEASTRRR